MSHPNGYNFVKISQDGSRFYLSFINRGTRSRRDFKTIKGALRHCEAMEYEVDMDDLPNPNATSVAHKVTLLFKAPDIKEAEVILVLEIGSTQITGVLPEFNTILKRLGHKPVRLTQNMLNRKAGWLVIDADTPSYCDPGCESYHTM